MRRPLIGISCGISRQLLSDINERYIQQLSSTYTNAVKMAGGIPLIIPNDLDEETLKDMAQGLDGFVFSGGGDVDPSIYGQEKDETTGGISRFRDETELCLMKHIIEDTNKPLFGICRGMQVLNVALGGTLIQDLPKAGKNNHSLTDHKREERTHEIIVKEGTRLSRILKEEKGVNSFHHQGIDVLGKGLIVSAYSKDDEVIEAVEAQGDRYILAVQWHPEELVANKGHLALFEEFIDQVNRVRQ